MEFLLSSLAMFGFVFLKAFQQRNVAFDHYGWILPTSMLMATAEVYVIAVIVRVGYDPLLVISVGCGGGLGCLLAMVVHRRMFRGIH